MATSAAPLVPLAVLSLPPDLQSAQGETLVRKVTQFWVYDILFIHYRTFFSFVAAASSGDYHSAMLPRRVIHFKSTSHLD